MAEMIETINTRAVTLMEIGLRKQEAKILSALIEKSFSARDLERMLDMRQPEVSLWTKNIQARGWIREGDKRLGSGRPEKMYELAMTYDNILKEIKTRMEKQVAYDKEKLKSLIQKRN